MDQMKIGKFIAKCRKENHLTQMELAEKLNITDRAISKWETGKSMPDTSIMLDLCKELKITVNDLLNGEIITMENYKEKTEKLIFDMAEQKQKADKRLLSLEKLIGAFSIIILLGFTFSASFFEMHPALRIALIAIGFIIAMIGFVYALKIEQTAGYYQCEHCKHQYVPEFKDVFLAMHVGTTRYMRCPKCNKHSWQKKTIHKENEE